MSTPASLERRIAGIEGVLRDLLASRESGTTNEVTVPNYLTTMADGTVSANFSGTVSAQGVTLPAGQSSGASGAINRVRWTRQSDGAMIAYTQAWDTGSQTGKDDTVFSTNGSVLLSLQADELATPNDANTRAILQALGFSSSAVRTLLDAKGQSSFMQLMNLGNLQMQIWNLTYPGVAGQSATDFTMPAAWPHNHFWAFAHPWYAPGNTGWIACQPRQVGGVSSLSAVTLSSNNSTVQTEVTVVSIGN